MEKRCVFSTTGAYEAMSWPWFPQQNHGVWEKT